MKRFFYLSIIVSAAIYAEKSAAQQADTIAIQEIQKVEVVATRAKAGMPIVYTDMEREQIERNSYAFDIPTLLELTPSVIATNETGIGIGGTSIRMRGTDASRINVTINGMSLNNPDSHSVYWYDTPDIISAVGSVQIQRGAGLSTNGSGTFGGAVSMATDALPTKFGGSASLSYGSYNTNKEALQISSGLVGGHWSVDARVSHISSDGYIARGKTSLASYMLQAGYYNSGTLVKLLSFGGRAKTYLTYTGTTREQIALYGRRYHTSGQYRTTDGPYSLADGTRVNYYDDQTDNYLQINNQIIVSHQFNTQWSLSATAFYTYGYGYYNQYKDDAWLAGYTNLATSISQADLIRSKVMRNHTEGINASAEYRSRKTDVIFGGSWSYYTCPHWGNLRWVDGMENGSIGGQWYDNDVNKMDANLFVRVSWQPVEGLFMFADMQYRYVRYHAWGTNDNFDWGSMQMQPISVNRSYKFANPRIGVNYTIAKRNTIYASFALAQREPSRSDFTDRYHFASDNTPDPKHEELYDFEVGYAYRSEKLSMGVNLYYMLYRNQLVATGMVNDGDDALNINVPKSYRRGIELMIAWKPCKWLTLGGNATLSQNKIKNYIDTLAGSPTEGEDLGDKTISYSPSVIASVYTDFHVKGFSAVWRTRYVGKQYFTNNETDALSLRAYCVTDLDLGYHFATKHNRDIELGIRLNNLLNNRYLGNGYGYSYMYNGKRYDEAYLFPQAPLHALANVTIKF